MHAEAFAWVESLHLKADRVIEAGSRNVNGSVRDVIAHNEWVGVDRIEGEGVDWVGDIVDYWPKKIPQFDLFVCCEVLEHAENVDDVLWAAHLLTRPGGYLLVTCATAGRAPHSAVDGGPLRDGEWYQNVAPFEENVHEFTVVDQQVHLDRGDLYALLRKAGG